MKKIFAICLISLLLLCSCKQTKPPEVSVEHSQPSSEISSPEVSIAQSDPTLEQVYAVTGGYYYKDKVYLADDIYEKAKKYFRSDYQIMLGDFWIIDDSIFYSTLELEEKETDEETQDYYDAVLYRTNLEFEKPTEIYKTKSDTFKWFASDAPPNSAFIFDRHENLFYFLNRQNETKLSLTSIDVTGQNEKSLATIDTTNALYSHIGTAQFAESDEKEITVFLRLSQEETGYDYQIQRYSKSTGKVEIENTNEYSSQKPKKVTKNGEEYLFYDFDLCAKNITSGEEKIIADFSEHLIVDKENGDDNGSGTYLSVQGINGKEIIIEVHRYGPVPAYKLYALLTYNLETKEKKVIYQSNE